MIGILRNRSARYPGGVNAFYLDGHGAWRSFKLLRERYNPQDRDVRWWF